MKTIIYFISLSLLVFSCTPTIDFTDTNSISETLDKALLKKDTFLLIQIHEKDLDSLEEFRQNELEEAFTFRSQKGVSLLKMDTSVSVIFDKEYPYLRLFYKFKQDYYRISAGYERDKQGQIQIKRIGCDNISEECRNDTTEVFNPRGNISFRRFIWEADYRNTSFENARIEVKNETGMDLTYLKLKVSLHKNTLYNTEEFFSQTIEFNDKIYKGDIVTIPIPRLSNHYVGFSISKESFTYYAETVEALPKPESYMCKLLEEITVK